MKNDDTWKFQDAGGRGSLTRETRAKGGRRGQEEESSFSSLDSTFIGVYPNPTDGLLNIVATGYGDRPMIWRIHDLMGRQIGSGLLVKDRTQVNISYFTPGTYVLNVEADGMRETTFKVILFDNQHSTDD